MAGMNRRNFLQMMVGGVVATAAVRSFPFRVFSFPTKITVPEFMCYPETDPVWDRVTMTKTFVYLDKSGVWEIDSVGSHLLSVHPVRDGLPHGIYRSEEIDIEEAKRIFPDHRGLAPLLASAEVHASRLRR